MTTSHDLLVPSIAWLSTGWFGHFLPKVFCCSTGPQQEILQGHAEEPRTWCTLVLCLIHAFFFFLTSISEFSVPVLSSSNGFFCEGEPSESVSSLLGLSVATGRDITEVTHL